MILRSHERFSCYLDLVTQREFEDKQNLNTNGWYKFIDDGVFTALTQEEKRWYLLYDGKKIKITGRHSSRIKKLDNRDNYIFQLLEHESMIVEFIYRFDESILYENDTTGFIEREDFDWGLFIQNRINQLDIEDI